MGMDQNVNDHSATPESSPDPGANRRVETNLSRRQALRYGAASLAGAIGASSLIWYFAKASREAAPAAVFKGDAPKGRLWEQWRKRGWVKEAYHYLKLGRNVQCKVCPNNCLLEPGDRSHCRNKVNRDGVLYTLAYGNPCTFHIDPIEKKPLFHFLPGTQSFSLATSGCVFRCLNCQNWEISQKKPEETKDSQGPEFRLKVPVPAAITLAELNRLSLFPDDLAAVAQALGCPSISYTYSEPTAYFEYAYDACQAARKKRIKNVLVSCGSIEERPLRDIAQFVDAAHIDLKGFDEAIYQQLNSGKLQPILTTLQTLKSMGVWFEIINLIVPTYTDDPDMIRRMCHWLVSNLGPDQPLHFSRFSPQHKLTHLTPTPLSALIQARTIARESGLHYVYVGNAPELEDAETTYCPNCKRAIVERDIFSVKRLDITAGRCKACQHTIAGVWS